MARTTRSTIADRAEWTTDMRATLPPGSTVYTIIRNVSASGMTRSIDAYALTADPDDSGRIVKRWLSYRAAAILGWPYDERRECVKVGGAGMDMGFHLVYTLSSHLYPDGFDCIGDRCPSNDHRNARRNDEPVPQHHASGGYALRQEWL